MGKEKRNSKITDWGAKAVFWHDRMQAIADEKIIACGRRIISGAAGLVNFHDLTQQRLDRLFLIIHYHFAKFAHEERIRLEKHKKAILGHFTGVILVAIALVALFNHATGYTYAYNGKVLGYVKYQEDVLKILDLVSDELSEEYGSNIQISKDTNISFESVIVLDKEIDDTDTVLKRLTYMSDMEAEAYGIYIDGRNFVICENETSAENALKAVQKEYLNTDKNTTYEDVGFKENVEIRKVKTKLANIRSVKYATDAIMNGGSKEIAYEVKAGDTFSEICSEFDVTFEELKKINPDIDINSLYPGDKIIINKATSALTVQTVEVSRFTEKVKYKTEYRKSDSMYKGDSKVIQKGVNGKRVVKARITRQNGEIVDKEVLETETIKKPVKKIVVKGTKKVPKTAPTGKLVTPVYGYTMTSPFGWRWGRMHEGVDMACATGTPIRAADGGTVIYAGWYSGYGLFIEIDHGGGRHTRYGHCSAVDVSVGEKVYQGQVIGAVGNTGNSYGSHLHFEVTEGGSPQNPFNYI